VVVQELHGAARAEMWPKLVADVPHLDDYQISVDRQIPVLLLTRR
jgi:hypothetical protein